MILEVQNLSLDFSVHGKKIHAVRDVSFSLKEGETVGLVGESGSGKSTLAQALLRLSPAEIISGKALFEKEDLLIKKNEEFECIRGRKIGMVFQDPMTSLNPTMKISTQIAEAMIYHKLASKQEALKKARVLLELVGVPGVENRYPHTLSGGQRQRVLIASAISCNPKLLIADEPTTALDAIMAMQILDLLKTLQQKGKQTLLLITHDLRIVSKICDRILVMYGGKIVEEGNVKEIFLRPKHPYTQMLLKTFPRLEAPKHLSLVPIPGMPPHLSMKPIGCSFAPRCPLAEARCREKEPPLINGAACWKTS